ncbi:MAG: DUF2927 domain-containing protein [Pseudomonadota bacterium]
MSRSARPLPSLSARPPARRAARALRRAAPALALLAGLAACAPSTQERYALLSDAYEQAGLMRAESAPEDAPFDKADLVRNFERIAFYSEFSRSDGRLEVRRSPVSLVKWQGDVTWNLEGDGVTEADREAYRVLADRLEALTGLDFVETDARPSVLILIASAELRRDFVQMLRRRGVADRMQLIEEWADNDLYPCVGQIGWFEENGVRQSRAMIVIKEETTGRLRESCIHEELAQALGLLNDDDRVRPSIFNDDQEFALLTEHDEYLLRILYDPRLEAGMTREEGMPIVREIVEEIGPEDRS